ncbi:MAG: hypothetical protein QNJ70_00440 [Xenococcaceae cyanobacterium MO_207.B15]|nr:hypothetical protein [Xenococcaceae cyanobacterium MO_207.B15]
MEHHEKEDLQRASVNLHQKPKVRSPFNFSDRAVWLCDRLVVFIAYLE